MTSLLCKLGLHRWRNVSRSESRQCARCGKAQIWMGHQAGGEWHDV